MHVTSAAACLCPPLQIVTVADTGIDTGVANTLLPPLRHAFATGGQAHIIDDAGRGNASDTDGHGTHVCCSVVGADANHGGISGTAPEADHAIHTCIQRHQRHRS